MQSAKRKLLSRSQKLCLFVASALCLNALPFNLITSNAKAATENNTVTVSVDLTTTIAMTIFSSSDSKTIEAGTGVTSLIAGALLPNEMIDDLWSNVTVYTNSASGYKLTVSDTDANTSLSNHDSLIPSGSSIQAGTSAWGIKGGLLTSYSAMVPSDQSLVVAQSEDRTERGGAMTNVRYAISTSADQHIGEYENTIVYTLTSADDTPDTPQVSNPFGIAYMHEMTSSVCANVPTPSNAATMLDKTGEYQNDTTNYVQAADLIDARDGKTYTVAKLADGNCWMVQDLDTVLGVAASGELIGTEILTPAYTDVSASVITVDAAPRQAGVAWESNDAWNTYQDAAYGMYYNWYSATASSGDSTTTGEASESICPKGWRLPSSSNGTASYQTLISSYTSTTWVFDATQAPLNFILKGSYYAQNAFANMQGGQGHYLTSRASSAGQISTLYQWGASGMTYDGSASKADGLAVRCVAR